MIPAHARQRHGAVLDREGRLAQELETSPPTRVGPGDRSVGIVTAGLPYAYVRECLPGASVLKPGASYPLGALAGSGTIVGAEAAKDSLRRMAPLRFRD